MDSRNDSVSLEEHFAQLNEVTRSVQNKLVSVQNQYMVSYETIHSYLEVNEPDLLASITQLENDCNSDILGRAVEGTVSRDEFFNWRDLLNQWKIYLLEGIERFENYQMMANVA